MSCGCGGTKLPMSTQLRIQAANIAATAMSGNRSPLDYALKQMAVAAFEFITCDLDLATLDKPAETAVPEGVKARQELVGKPLTYLDLVNMPTVIRFLYENRVKNIGMLTAKTGDELARFGIPDHKIDAIGLMLKPYGLRLGMSLAQLHHWVAHGNAEETEKREAIGAGGAGEGRHHTEIHANDATVGGIRIGRPTQE